MLPAEIQPVLSELLAGAQAALGEQFVAMYLYGSLSSGGFNPATSDIDFVVVTEGALAPERVVGLEALHRRLWAGGDVWAAHLEGAYLPRADLRRYDPAAPPAPCVNEGQFYVGRFGSDWVIQRQVVREQGVVLAGPPPASLIDPVTPDEIRRATAGIVCEFWGSVVLADPNFLRRPDYQAFAVLTMCRARYALAHGAILSKPAAAAWAATALPARWRALIQDAAAWQPPAVLGRVDEIAALIRDTVDHAKD